MPGKRDHYQTLGLSRNASTDDIKKRYRELARKYHPDVVDDKTTGSKAFLQINEAYRTLVDADKRRAYDSTLSEPTQTVRTQQHPAQRPEPTVTQHNRPSEQVQKLVKDAEVAFIRRRLNQAADLCKQAIKLDVTCARAHVILGDIYKTRRLYEHSINEYNYALQFNPTDKETLKKMERLLDRARPLTFSWESPEGKLSVQAILFNIIGFGAAIFLVFLVYIYPGEPISWFTRYNVPLVQNWSWNLIGIMLADGAVAGFMLGINGFIAHPDDELIFETGGRGLAIVPTGFLLLLFSPFFFLGAAVLYLVLAFIQDTISKSLLKVFGVVMGIVLLSAVLYPKDTMSVFLLGGNVVFVGALFGWYIGAILRSDS
jgi:tetratricopeptide (TPR) repeat protein